MPAAGSAGLSRQVVATTRFAFSLKVNVTVASMRRRFGALIFRDIKEVLAMSDTPGLSAPARGLRCRAYECQSTSPV